MNYIYPALFYLEEDGNYSVIFPDLNDLATYGNTLEDALCMAQEACGMYIFNSIKDGEKLPSPTPIDKIKTEAGSFVNMVLVDLD